MYTLATQLEREDISDEGKALKRPNVILILADDLGYGDTSVMPFTSPVFKNLSITPELERMALSGRTMTNFHVASPVCSPSRASIMTALFPWRLGVDFIYAQDLKNDGSEELDHEQLPMVPNMAMSFRDSGYHTAHVGKWHLGGLSKSEITRRQACYSTSPKRSTLSCNVSACVTPGLLQYGYDEYVSMSEGNEDSDRYVTQQHGVTYKQGARHFVRNDVKMVASKEDRWLTDAQTDEAIRIVREQSHSKTPFFLNLWYDAPHSPWEAAEPFYSAIFRANRNLPTRLHKYMSMIANMDWNIGRLLRVIDELGIAENTLILFTSDNGPEINAGSGGPFQGGKRVLMEGGIRVPAIWQWKGTIPANTSTSIFGMSTDIYPTMLHAANLRMPPHVRIDGVSFLPVLSAIDAVAKSADSDRSRRTALKTSASSVMSASPASEPDTVSTKVNNAFGDERTVMWYTHCPGFPKFAAAWAYGYKLVWNDYEGRQAKKLPAALRMFDMRADPEEIHDVLPQLARHCNAYVAGESSALRSISWENVDAITRNLSSARSKGRGKAEKMSSEEGVALLGIANYLHVRAHLFRYIGNEDWLRYHENKPYTVEKHCSRRRAKVDTLTWGTALPPDFCGDGIAADPGSANCKCALSKCPLSWLAREINTSSVYTTTSTPFFGSAPAATRSRSGWLSGPLLPGLTSLAAPGSSLHTYLAKLLEWSNFQPICSKDPIMRVSPFLATAALNSRNSSGSFTSKSYQRVYQRDAKKRNIYVTGSACVLETPGIWQNAHGMHAPIELCPSSLRLLGPGPNSAPEFDDNAMVFALNDVLFTKNSVATSVIPGAFDAAVVRIGNHTYDRWAPIHVAQRHPLQMAVVDPMFAYGFHAHQRLDDPVADVGYFSHVMHRLHTGISPVLLALPFLSDMGWVALFVYVPPAERTILRTRKANSADFINQMPVSIIMQPNVGSELGNRNAMNVTMAMHDAVLHILRKARPYESERWTQQTVKLLNIAADTAGAGSARTGMRLLMVAHSLRQALDRQLPLADVLSHGLLQAVLNTASATIDKQTIKLHEAYILRGKQQIKKLETEVRKTTYFPNV